MAKSDTAIQNADEPRPVLWIGLTETGRMFADDEHLDHVAERVREAVGNEYAIVAADDRVRLASEDDLDELRQQLARTRQQLRKLEGGED